MKKPVTIQVDASGSKALTPTKQHYVNNEGELLTCVFSAECFQTYMYSVDTSQSRMADAPVCLQRMLL